MIGLSRKRLMVTTLVLFVFGCGLWTTWEVCDWPPVRLIVKYGFPPAGGPTGRRMTVQGIEFIELSPGYFRMGSHHSCVHTGLFERVLGWIGFSNAQRVQHRCDECPPHWVEISTSFWISRAEVSNQDFERFRAAHNRSEFNSADDDPATLLSWNDARAYCHWLGHLHGIRVRLPSEAEWEYACRAGTSAEFSFGNDPLELAEYAWFRGNSNNSHHSIGSRKPNDWGLYDLHGSAWEWCQDSYHPSYIGAPQNGAAWESTESRFRVFRGGGADCSSVDCRVARRAKWFPTSRNLNLGFRPVCETERGNQ